MQWSCYFNNINVPLHEHEIFLFIQIFLNLFQQLYFQYSLACTTLFYVIAKWNILLIFEHLLLFYKNTIALYPDLMFYKVDRSFINFDSTLGRCACIDYIQNLTRYKWFTFSFSIRMNLFFSFSGTTEIAQVDIFVLFLICGESNQSSSTEYGSLWDTFLQVDGVLL